MQRGQRCKDGLDGQHPIVGRKLAALGSGKDLGQRVALLQRKHTRLCAAQCRQGRRYTEGGADFLSQHTDVGALGAGHPDRVLILCGAAEVFNVIDRDGARRALNGLALAGSLVQRLAVDLDRTVHRRQLHPVTTELRQHGAQLLRADRDGGCFQRFAGHIPGVGAQS